MLAALLSSGEPWRHGYDLARETDLKSGTLYPILMRLERQGWLEARWEDDPVPGRPWRHLYRLTGLGIEEARAIVRPAPAPAARFALEGGAE